MIPAVLGTRQRKSFHPVLRVASKIISYLVHPLFIPLYVLWFLIYELRLFPGDTSWYKTKLLISFFVNYTFLPLVTILLMKALGFIQSVLLKTQKDRIMPYVVCEIFYFWAWYVAKNNGYPKPVVVFALGVFLATCLGMILNSYLKISMHSISLGVVAAFMLVLGLTSDMNLGFYISAVFLIAGLTATARMIDSNHTTQEIYAGFFSGVVMQVIAYLFV